MKKGFSLIEVVFVLVIIAALAIVAVTAFYNMQQHAVENKEAYTVSSIQEGIDLLRAQEMTQD